LYGGRIGVLAVGYVGNLSHEDWYGNGDVEISLYPGNGCALNVVGAPGDATVNLVQVKAESVANGVKGLGRGYGVARVARHGVSNQWSGLLPGTYEVSCNSSEGCHWVGIIGGAVEVNLSPKRFGRVEVSVDLDLADVANSLELSGPCEVKLRMVGGLKWESPIVIPGDYSIRVRGRNGWLIPCVLRCNETELGQVTIGAGEVIEGKLSLAPEASRRFIVVDAAGRPLEGVFVGVGPGAAVTASDGSCDGIVVGGARAVEVRKGLQTRTLAWTLSGATSRVVWTDANMARAVAVTSRGKYLSKSEGRLFARRGDIWTEASIDGSEWVFDDGTNGPWEIVFDRFDGSRFVWRGVVDHAVLECPTVNAARGEPWEVMLDQERDWLLEIGMLVDGVEFWPSAGSSRLWGAGPHRIRLPEKDGVIVSATAWRRVESGRVIVDGRAVEKFIRISVR